MIAAKGFNFLFYPLVKTTSLSPNQHLFVTSQRQEEPNPSSSEVHTWPTGTKQNKTDATYVTVAVQAKPRPHTAEHRLLTYSPCHFHLSNKNSSIKSDTILSSSSSFSSFLNPYKPFLVLLVSFFFFFFLLNLSPVFPPSNPIIMYGQDHHFFASLFKDKEIELSDHQPFIPGGLFLDHKTVCPPSFVSIVYLKKKGSKENHSYLSKRTLLRFENMRRRGRKGGVFLSVSLSIKGREEDGDEGNVGESIESLGQNGVEKNVEVVEEKEVEMKRSGTSAALNTTKHLWAGVLAAMVSRTFVAPLERLKLEYIVRGEQKNLFEVIKVIAATQGLKGFWKGNFVNILRTAPFKSINFYAYDTYRSQLLKLSGNEETTNFERFLSGAAAGITATLLCLPMDTIRTKMVAPGGEVLGGVIGTFRHMIQTEGFFSLYKGLLPSLVAMAPSGAVYYGVYDMLKSAYLHSPEGRKRLQNIKQEGEELNALEQLELGTKRTLLYGAIAGCCSEAATYPFEVVRRQLQMQVRATKMSALATCIKIVEQGGIPALYAGLIPSLLQVLPSAAISYFVYEFMKIVLKVEST